MFAIVVNEKGGEQKRLEFDKAEVTIGRVQGNDIILPKGNVSKRHSRIVLKDGKFIIVDLKSTNGTYVNGRKITSPLVIKPSDKIYIGDFILAVDEGEEGAQLTSSMATPGPQPRKPPPPPPRREAEAEDEADAGMEPPPSPPAMSLPIPPPPAAYMPPAPVGPLVDSDDEDEDDDSVVPPLALAKPPAPRPAMAPPPPVGVRTMPPRLPNPLAAPPEPLDDHDADQDMAGFLRKAAAA